MSRVLPGVLVLLCVAACTFAPDLSRYAACDAQGGCPSGSTCLTSESRCVPDCGGGAETCGAPDPLPVADGDDAGADAGAGTDAGEGGDGGADSGVDGGDVVEPLGLDPDALVTGREMTAYSGRLRARGGKPPYVFSATAALPAGLTLNAEGDVTGTPTVAGVFSLSVNVTDQGTPPRQASGSIPLRVYPLLWLAGPGTLAAAPTNKAYEESLSAIGGRPPYRFALADGTTLPGGLRLAEDGQVTGTSAQVGRVEFTVTVTDSDLPPQESTRQLSVTTANAGLALLMMTQALPDGRVGTVYSYTLRHAGGTGPYKWTLQGAMPPGLFFDADQGRIYGTPEQSDDYPVSITLSDLLQVVPRTLTLVVKE
jgi:hypothetical protein